MKQKINDNIQYQEGAVVSREIVKKETGNVTLFAFDKGQGLSEHTAPFDALILITDGTAQVMLSGKKHLLKSGEMLLMSAGARHSHYATERFKMLLVMIKSRK